MGRIYEFRTYKLRPGKLEAFRKRFEERDAVWRRFVADPEWHALRAESEERHGAIVAEERTVILTPGACSPMQ